MKFGDQCYGDRSGEHHYNLLNCVEQQLPKWWGFVGEETNSAV